MFLKINLVTVRESTTINRPNESWALKNKSQVNTVIILLYIT